MPRAPQSGQAAPGSGASAKKTKRGPRAIGVVEFLPGGATRLVPVTLWIDGKYYDASLYGANPEPVALDPGTVYEAQQNGEPTGLFVVNTPKQQNGSWVADGRWKPHLGMDEKVASDKAKQAASKPKPKENKTVFTGGPDEGPPVLKRSGASGSQSGSGTQGSQQQTQTQQSGAQDTAPGASSSKTTQTASSQSGRPTLSGGEMDQASSGSSRGQDSGSQQDSGSVRVDSDPNRPVLKRSPAPEDAKPRASASDDDPDRPVLTKPAASSSSGSGSAASPEQGESNDPDRPVLSRGKPAAPGQNSTVATPTATISKSSTTPVKAVTGQMRSYAAISDAGQYTNRPMLYVMTPEERQQKAPAMLQLALADIRAFAAKRPGPAIPKTATITDYDLRIFDLDFSNTPTEVISAKLPVSAANGKPFAYYVTIVARLDINDQPQKIFSVVSDSTHLDAYPRMELIDAIDADANGRGDLLFRQYSDVGSSYALYRVFPYQMEKIFEGGSAL